MTSVFLFDLFQHRLREVFRSQEREGDAEALREPDARHRPGSRGGRGDAGADLAAQDAGIRRDGGRRREVAQQTGRFPSIFS